MRKSSLVGAMAVAGCLIGQARADYSIEGDGVVTAISETESAIVCTNSGTLKVNRQVEVELLLLGGGGGGGNGGYSGGGGGGAGGFVHVESLVLRPGEYEFTIGKGGAENEKGGDSSFYGYWAYGGGAGNTGFSYDGQPVNSGASGGGAAGISNWARSGGSGDGFSGHDGGDNFAKASKLPYPVKNNGGQIVNTAGGGGGAGAPGGVGSVTYTEGDIKEEGGETYIFTDSYVPGAGGDGLPCSITGEEVYYAGGGGGGHMGWYKFDKEAPGGKGGGGRGGSYQDWGWNDGDPASGAVRDGQPGADGFGGGGGGGGANGNNDVWSSKGGKGGCGALIVRWRERFRSGSPLGEGGSITQYIDSVGTKWYIHTFRESGTFKLPVNALCDVLVVGGGGAGGAWENGPGGGGGAGGVIYRQQVGLYGGEYVVTVGAGGGVHTNDNVITSDAGGDSSLGDGYVAKGGGKGGTSFADDLAPAERAGRVNCAYNGGSGGGAPAVSDYKRYGGLGTDGQGHDGGGNVMSTNVDNLNIKDGNGVPPNSAGGGGGAGEAGESGSFTLYPDRTNPEGAYIVDYQAGRGGAGIVCDITGEEVCYGGGGSGGENGWYRNYREGSLGGGGAGGACMDPNLTDGQNGTDGLGGGGGGAGGRGNDYHSSPGAGGSGIVIIRYRKYLPGFSIRVR